MERTAASYGTEDVRHVALATMKILHVIHSANPAGGGPIEAIKQLAGALDDAHTTELVCLDTPDAPWLSCLPFPVHALGPAMSGYGYSPRFIPWMHEHESSYDAIVVNGLWQFGGFGTWCALQKSGRKYFVFPHGMLDPWFKRRYPLKHLKKWLYWPWAEYRVLRDADAVLFTCEEERIQARKSFWLYRCNELVVNFGTAAPPGEASPQRAAFLEKFPHLRDRRSILFLGRIHEKKGCMELVDAFAQVLASRPVQSAGLALVMAGPAESEYAREVQKSAERLGVADRITWTGMLGGDLKWGAFHAAEAFVLPSHQENFGIAVAEALACSTPVLISNKVNIWREVEKDGAGLVENDDRPGTVRLLERWLETDASSRDQMSWAARRCFEHRFEITQAARSLVTALDAKRRDATNAEKTTM